MVQLVCGHDWRDGRRRELLGVYILLAYYASGLVWWVSWARFFSGPLAGVGAAVAFFPPRQRAAYAAGLLCAGTWLILWVLCLTVFGFEFGATRG